jgi:acetyl esterase/lipase
MDWSAAYSNRDAIPGAADYPPRWAARAAAFRAACAPNRVRLDLPYGDDARERFDLFLPAVAPRGLFVFVHGGYWLAFSKSDWSHLAAGPLARGWAAATPSYPLCPQVRFSEIARAIARAVEVAARDIAGPIRLAGHSAGGHLVTRLLCEGSRLDAATLARVECVVSISGLHDLRPLTQTAMNAQLRLDAQEAAAESPALLSLRKAVATTCWVGADELPEFRRQNALLANVWTGLGVATRSVEAPGRHHFTVVDALEDPASELAALCAP